jgi:hypothetical protein
MRFGFRTPSIKRSFKAHTTGYLKRTARRAVDPFYGTPGIGLIKGPRRAAYNKVYRGATYGMPDFFKTTGAACGATTATATASPDAAQTATFYADGAPMDMVAVPKRRHPFRTACLITLAVIIFGGAGAAIALGLVAALGLIPVILVFGILAFLFGGKR